MRKPQTQTTPRPAEEQQSPTAKDVVSAEIEGEKSLVEGVVKHGLPLALGALTIFGVAGYSVGRAYLEGWYAAAGVPVLTFNWDLQYVVLRGLSQDMLRLWLFEIITIAVMIALYCSFDYGLSKAVSWRSSRSAKRPASPERRESPTHSREFKKWLRSLMLCAMLLCGAGLWYGGSQLLNDVPRHQGGDDFRALFQSATCVDSEGKFTPTHCAPEGLKLGPYPWVEIHSAALDANVHGWLLQHQGSSLLTISRSGVNLLSLGDTPFRISNSLSGGGSVRFNAAARISEPRPQFKGEASPPEGTPISAAELPTPAASPIAKPAAAAHVKKITAFRTSSASKAVDVSRETAR